MTATPSQRFHAAMELVDRVLDASPSERGALLDACDDEGVREDARRFLEADAHAGNFLVEPAAARVPSAVAPLGARAANEAIAGDVVGPFRLVSFLGRGGMGEVWAAERLESDFEQHVAVKLLPVSSDAAGAARFRRERRILGRLSNPRIAKLLDGGVTNSGRPWLAMELISGVSLTEYCVSHRMGLDARLRLFASVCDVVHFAHKNLVVHRDLKPSNILVEANGEPKLLDFGIAKLLEDTGDGVALTRTEERPMTLEYAAPEQVRGEPVTTASDVWALGVILYELLTGTRPYGRGKGRAETEQDILAAVPTRPSARLDRTEGRRLRGDLDAIVLKAMRADPGQRYPSSEALGADVQRHLHRAPVAARGDATSYLIRTMLRRHRTAFGLSSLAVILLVIGLVGTLWQAHRARQEARKAEQAQDFLVSMLGAFDPEQAGGNPITQREILERGEARLTELHDQPEVQARLLHAFAVTWFDIKEYERSRASAEKALALERVVAPRGAEVPKTLLLIGNVDFEEGDFNGAERVMNEALANARSLEGPRGLTVAQALNDIAGVRRRLTDFAEAERLRRESLGIYRAALGERDATTLAVMNDLAVLIGDAGRFAESAELQEHTCKLMDEVRGEANPDTLMCRSNLARDLIELGRAGEAEAIMARVYAKEVEVLGDDWADISNTEQMRARALDALGRSTEALSLFEDAILRLTKQLGPDHPDVAVFLTRESRVLRHLGMAAKAEEVSRRALSIVTRRLGDEHAMTGRAYVALGSAMLDEGKLDDARVQLERGIAVEERVLGASHPDTMDARAELERTHGPKSTLR